VEAPGKAGLRALTRTATQTEHLHRDFGGRGAAGVASVERDQGLPCAKHSQLCHSPTAGQS